MVEYLEGGSSVEAATSRDAGVKGRVVGAVGRPGRRVVGRRGRRSERVVVVVGVL